jgi:excisionase family DNA binding protein
LDRRAIVYVRQSTVTQVISNLESQRRQYELATRARDLGFREVQVIDDDLGRSSSGVQERPGFQRLVAEVCAGQVGGVLCLEASRLARNGRDWHHLVDLCGLVGTVIIDPEGVYDPRLPNDRLLLGMKGTMSEFELSLFRQRSFEAIRSKARRGELQFCLPIGLSWSDTGGIELDADRRVQEAIRLVFRKLRELGSVRQALLWMRGNRIMLPSRTYGSRRRPPTWKLPVYNNLHSIVTNPFYAGAYAFGRTHDRTRIVGDRVRKTRGHAKSLDEWTVLIRDHHPGYISWDEFERNQEILSDNAHMKQRMAPKAGRGGRGLLAGLIRCRRCGRMLHVSYTGVGSRVVRYACQGAHINHGESRCISFGGLRVEQTMTHAIVEAVSPYAIDAAVRAAERVEHEHADCQQARSLELEQARYEVRLAARRYEAVDPENRLVATELEARWNAALSRVNELEAVMAREQVERTAPDVDRATLLALADTLPAVWNSPGADMRLKQRIVRLLVHEVVADVDDKRSEIVLVIHWHGGRHTEFRRHKNKTGHHRRSTSEEAVDVIRRMAGRWPDEHIAATLNRIGLKTGTGKSWNQGRVYLLRKRLKLPAFDATISRRKTLTLTEAARALGVSNTIVRRLIVEGHLPAKQAVKYGPFEISEDALNTAVVRKIVREARHTGRIVRDRAAARRTLPLPGLDKL